MIRLLILVAAALWSVTPATAAAPRFAVIFEVDVLENGQVEKLAVDHVIDAQSGSKDPIALAVPDAFVAAVRTKLNAKASPPTKRHFFTYFFYDPNDPTNTDIGVEK